jgi:hypothetical protein
MTKKSSAPIPAESKRTLANQANAKKSTGPKSPEGKQRSSLNALRHGLTGRTMVLPGEDHVAYDKFCKYFFEDLKPKGIVELQLCQMIADSSWRLNHVAAMETNHFTLGLITGRLPVLTGNDQSDVALNNIETLRQHTTTVATLSLHGQRLARQFERNVKQLQELQAKRKAEEQSMARAGQAAHKTSDGFVFSNSKRAAKAPLSRSTSNAGINISDTFHSLHLPNFSDSLDS